MFLPFRKKIAYEITSLPSTVDYKDCHLKFEVFSVDSSFVNDELINRVSGIFDIVGSSVHISINPNPDNAYECSIKVISLKNIKTFEAHTLISQLYTIFERRFMEVRSNPPCATFKFIENEK